MTISQYRRWYEIVYCLPCALSDAELQGIPFILVNDAESHD